MSLILLIGLGEAKKGVCFIARQSQHTLTIQTTNQISTPTRVADTKRRKSRVDKLRIGTGAPLPPPFGGGFRMEVMGVLIKETN